MVFLKAFEKPDKTPGLNWNQLLDIDGILVVGFFLLIFFKKACKITEHEKK